MIGERVCHINHAKISDFLFNDQVPKYHFQHFSGCITLAAHSPMGNSQANEIHQGEVWKSISYYNRKW